MKLRRIHLATATALGVLAFIGFGSQAHAGAYAFADLEVTNFEIDSGGVILSNANTSTGGTAGGTVNVTSVLDAFTTVSTLNGVTIAQSANPSNICQGSAAGCTATGAAPFSFVTPPLTSGSFSQAADSLTGSPVSGVFGLPTPANAKTAAQTQLIGLAGGNASSTLGLTSGFNFTLTGPGSTTTLTMKFDGFVNLIAGLDATGISAQASSALSFTITDNTTHKTLLVWAPDGQGDVFCTAATACSVIADPSSLNTDAGSTTPGFVDQVTNTLAQLFELQFTLPDGDSLTLTINHETQAFAASTASIPEPTTLALFGASLLGLGWMSRRKKLS